MHKQEFWAIENIRQIMKKGDEPYESLEGLVGGGQIA